MAPFHPVIKLPDTYDLFNFTEGYDPQRIRGVYGIGRYNEDRRGMYTTDLFSPDSQEARTIHMGIDIGAPVLTEVFAFDDGEIFCSGIRSTPGDYGGTLITKHKFEGRTLYALLGHLAHRSIRRWKNGDRFTKGTELAVVGAENENGGWNPHLHFQLSWLEPVGCDMPGVVSVSQREQALRDYPDPRLVLGALYSDAART